MLHVPRIILVLRVLRESSNLEVLLVMNRMNGTIPVRLHGVHSKLTGYLYLE